MNIDTLKITNLDILYKYCKERKDKGSMMIGPKAIDVYNSAIITMVFSNVNLLEAYYLHELSSNFKISNFDDVERFTKEELENMLGDNTGDEYLDNLENKNKFFEYYNENEIDNDGIDMYNAILELKYRVVCVFRGSIIMSLMGSSSDNIFMNENNDLVEFNTETEKVILDKFSLLFVNSFYSNINSKLNIYDEVTSNVMDLYYSDYVDTEDAELLRIDGPFGATLNLSDADEEILSEFKNNIDISKTEFVFGETRFTISVNSTLYTFFKLVLSNDGFNATIDFMKECGNNNLNASEVLLEKYAHRLDTFISPMLSQKNYLFSNTEDVKNIFNYFKLIFVPMNILVNYHITFTLHDIKGYDHIKEPVNEYDRVYNKIMDLVVALVGRDNLLS